MGTQLYYYTSKIFLNNALRFFVIFICFCLLFFGELQTAVASSAADILLSHQYTPLRDEPDLLVSTLYYVDGENGDDTTGDGSQSAPWHTITYALGQITGADVEIRIASGIYDQALGETFPIQLSPGVRLVGAGKDTTIISGQSDTSVIYIGSSTQDFLSDTAVSDLTIQNGSNGLQLYSSESHTVAPTITNLLLRWNRNGIYISTSDTYEDGAIVTATISNTEIISNTQYGIFMRAYGYFSRSTVSPLIDNCLVKGNGSHGIYIQSSAVSVNNTVASPQIIATDIVNNGGHGIYTQGSYQGWVNAQIERSQIENNQGYGFFWDQGINRGNINTSITNTVIALNQGGGVYLDVRSERFGTGTLRMLNSTVVDNENYGIYWQRVNSSLYRDVVPQVINTILWNPEADDLYSTSTAWSTTEIQYSDIEDGDLAGINGNVSLDPQFADYNHADYHLHPLSPLKDIGNSAAPNLPVVDIDGDTRPLGSGVDIGADEAEPYNLSIMKSVFPAEPIYPESVLTYTLALTNESSITAGGALVTDTLPINTTWSGYLQTDSGWASVVDGVLTWLSTIPVSGTNHITFTTSINSNLAVDTQITNTAIADNRTGTILETTPVTVTVAPAAILNTSRQFVDQTSAYPGQLLVYTLVLSNTGNIAATNVLVTNTLDTNVNFVSVDNDGMFDSGQIFWNDLTVASQEAITLSITGTIASPLADLTILTNFVSISDAETIHELPISEATTVVYNHPQAEWISEPTLGPLPLTVVFTNTSSHATNNLWSYGDGMTSTISTTHQHTYYFPGNYTVTLNVNNPVGSDVLTRTNHIRAYNSAQADFSGFPQDGIGPFEVTFTNNSQYADQFIWSYGDGLTSTITSPIHVHTYTTPGTYTVKLTAIGPDNSVVSEKSAYINVYSAPVASFSGGPLMGTAPLLVNFTNYSLNASNYHWNFGDGSSNSATNPAHLYIESGIYTVTLTASNPGGADTLDRVAYITVNAPPTPDFFAEPRVGAGKLTVTFTNTSVNADSYIWDYGDGDTNLTSEAVHTHTYSTPGSYSVSLTAINAYGSNTLTYPNYISVYETPLADFSATPLTGMTPLTVNFVNHSQDASAFLWDFGDGTTSTQPDPTHIYTEGGIFTVSLKASNLGGSDWITRSNYLDIKQGANPNFSGTPRIGNGPLAVTFSNTSNYADDFIWDYGDGITSTIATFTHTHEYVTPGLYTVTLTASNIINSSVYERIGYVSVFPSSSESIYYVDGENGDDAPSNGSQSAPWRTITYALSQVSDAGVEIRIASGIYDRDLGETFPIQLSPGIRLVGAGKDTTIISGESGASVLYIGSATTDFLSDTLVSDLTLQNGNNGLQLYSSELHTVAPTISNLILRWNGNGIYISTSATYKDGATVTPTISNTEIISNTQYGIFMRAYGYFSRSSVSPLIDNCLVKGNGSHGIYIQSSAVSVNNTVASPQIIATDIVNNGGHGIYAEGRYEGWVNAQIKRSQIENNQGYGFFWDQGINRGNINTSITNTVIALNDSGGLYLDLSSEYSGSSKLRMTNSTVVDNDNYGIYWQRTYSHLYRDVIPQVINTILWNPEADDLYSTSETWSTTEIQYSDIEDGDLDGQSGNFNALPLLSNDYHLLPGSPAIDSGTYHGAPSIDFDGDSRPISDAIDVGADEAWISSSLYLPIIVKSGLAP